MPVISQINGQGVCQLDRPNPTSEQRVIRPPTNRTTPLAPLCEAHQDRDPRQGTLLTVTAKSRLVLFVADLFHPVHRLAVKLFLNGDMGHRRG